MTDPKPLTVTIGGTEYEFPPIGWDAGIELTKYFTMPPDKLDKVKRPVIELYELAVGRNVWQKMKDDGADFILMTRAGFAALAHFQKRLQGASDDAARVIFDAIWESGIDPEALAAAMAARESSTTSPATAAAGSSTRRPANTSGTRSVKGKAATSRGRNSSPTKPAA